MQALSLAAAQTFDWITLPEATAPGPGEALVEIKAIGICGTDFSGYLGKMPFIQFPRILGHELGVEVLRVGNGVTHLKPGTPCSVEPYLNCGRCHACKQGRTNCCETLSVLGVHTDGGMRERMVLPAHKLHPHPGLSFEQLALVETLAIGCHAVNRSSLTATEDVLIVGAGPIGLTVLEFARLITPQITVLELNEDRRRFVAKHYPGTQVVNELPPEFHAQVIFDATGNAHCMGQAIQHAKFTGRIIYVGITKEPVLLDDPLFHRRELTLIASRNAQSSDFPRILDLINTGRIDTTPWISHRSDFQDLPSAMVQWLQPGSGVIKAVVTR